MIKYLNMRSLRGWGMEGPDCKGVSALFIINESRLDCLGKGQYRKCSASLGDCDWFGDLGGEEGAPFLQCENGQKACRPKAHF